MKRFEIWHLRSRAFCTIVLLPILLVYVVTTVFEPQARRTAVLCCGVVSLAFFLAGLLGIITPEDD
ncbi:hypothetical protein KSP35_22120 [Aquihabitans sp. G128]|uniref:hypothetical protein n=1 Tax=Aquihabitans sp. G128 TaxID=2849779 RepID=UPI001C223730|nr:hypothetical protein [Aquihabitans sp. G128]QXC60976.1 hypothetical protein KSP35_22120 [Aquihabitans sp. G128]